MEVVSNAFGTRPQMVECSTYELSIPLVLLGVAPKDGQIIGGDLGVLAGNGSATEQRLYWSNKSTTVVVDAPTEAMLTPTLWGEMAFKSMDNGKIASESFKSLPVGDLPAGSAAVGKLKIEPPLKEAGLLSIKKECPVGQSVNSLAVFGKAPTPATSLTLTFAKPGPGKGARISFYVTGGRWNWHSRMCLMDGGGAKTPLIDFGPSEKDKDLNKTLEFRQRSGKDLTTLAETSLPGWRKVELIWEPEKDRAGGEIFLKIDGSDKRVSVGKTDIVPEAFVLFPGYWLNYANFTAAVE